MTDAGFVNAEDRGYTVTPIMGSNKFVFLLNVESPLTYRDASGAQWQPDRRFVTDFGSVPGWVSRIPGYQKNRLAYLFHDSAYNVVDGKGHGLYRRLPAEESFTFCPLRRSEVDAMMREMLVVEGVRRSAAWVIWGAVRAFGPRW